MLDGYHRGFTYRCGSCADAGVVRTVKRNG
jgi:hypothetical protein